MAQANSKRNIAVLIDGDNAQYDSLKIILAEIEKHGMITICRAYGDWTKPNLAKWRQVMIDNTIEPMQQWRYATGKNATDSYLIIDAMDILYSGNVDGFCIVSSDSDYTRLCSRVRQDGLFVMGIGRKQTPASFTNACDIFKYVEDLKQKSKPKSQANNTSKNKSKIPNKPIPQTQLLNQFRKVYNKTKDADGWANLGAFGSIMNQSYPAFDTKIYGHSTLKSLIQSLSKKIEMKPTKSKGWYIRFREPKK